MKKSNQSTQGADLEEKANAALQEALNQPGIKVAMEIAEFAEKQASAADQYEAYLAWQRLPIVTNSCNSTTPF
jgi:hypothetical protein